METKTKVLILGGPDVDTRMELIHRLKDKYQITVVGSNPGLLQRFINEGYPYFTYHLGRQWNPLSELLTFIQLVFIIRRINPQIVHTFATKPCVWGRLAARCARVPIVVGTLPGLGALYANEDLKTRLIRTAYQPLQHLACHLSDLTIFQNYQDAQQFIDAGIVPAQKTKVILGSGVPTEIYSPDTIPQKDRILFRNDFGFKENDIIVTMISRLIRSKGILLFVAAAHEIQNLYPNVKFLLIGSNDNQSIDGLNEFELATLKRTVIWPGPRNDIPVVLAASDILVLPTAYREGMPRVLLEAAAMGLPIITSDSPGCNSVVEDGINGFLMPINDISVLIRRILQLVEGPDLRKRFGWISRQLAIRKFDLSLIANQTQLIYQQLLAA